MDKLKRSAKVAAKMAESIEVGPGMERTEAFRATHKYIRELEHEFGYDAVCQAISKVTGRPFGRARIH